jgi:uncharacterized protein YceK
VVAGTAVVVAVREVAEGCGEVEQAAASTAKAPRANSKTRRIMHDQQGSRSSPGAR